MLDLRLIRDNDLPLIEYWLKKEHVKRWYEIPQMDVTIDDWMEEIQGRNEEFQWITYLIVTWQEQAIGLCQYYKCEDSAEEDFGAIPLKGSYGIDYLIGEEDFIGKGLGKGMITLLVNRIFSFSDARRVTADIDKDNKASEKALLSCGFELLDAKNSRYVLKKSSWRT